MGKLRNTFMIMPLMGLVACMPESDLQGVDPQEYYGQHPVKNTVETRYASHDVHFSSGRDKLTADQIDALHVALSDIRPEAMEALQVQMHPSQIHNATRKQHLIKLLRSMGYSNVKPEFESSADVDRQDVKLDMTYAAVISPRCPDWRKSPVTTYSNTSHGNIGCSSAYNLGLMVADPRDLEKGSGNVTPDAERNAIVIQQYRSGEQGSEEDSSSDAASSSAASITGN